MHDDWRVGTVYLPYFKTKETKLDLERLTSQMDLLNFNLKNNYKAMHKP